MLEKYETKRKSVSNRDDSIISDEVLVELSNKNNDIS